MAYDLVIRGGTVIDGTGAGRRRADVAVMGDRIVAIGPDVDGRGDEEIDAEGHVVAPGFVDGHTHLDAQMFWDPFGTSPCWHGVTSVVMGNCGFTLAPCAEADMNLALRSLERAEDMSRAALLAGIDWRWETFPEYLDVVDALPKGINVASYVGHSTLRTYVMGERAFTDGATDDDLDTMRRHLDGALRAGEARQRGTLVSSRRRVRPPQRIRSREGGPERHRAPRSADPRERDLLPLGGELRGR